MATFSENIIEIVKKQYRTEGLQGIRSIFIRPLRIFQHFVCINSRFNGYSDTAFLYPNHISGKRKA